MKRPTLSIFNSDNRRSAEEIRKGLLKKAFDEGRGEEMQAEIDRRMQRVREAAQEDAEALNRARQMDMEEQRIFAATGVVASRYIRGFNLIQEREGSPHRLVETPEELQQLMDPGFSDDDNGTPGPEMG